MITTRHVEYIVVAAAIAAMLLFVHPVTATEYEGEILSIDYAVPHVSTVPANSGDDVVLFLRERVKAEKTYNFKRGRRGRRDHNAKKVVLFVHGGTVPSVAVYDLPFEDYS